MLDSLRGFRVVLPFSPFDFKTIHHLFFSSNPSPPRPGGASHTHNIQHTHGSRPRLPAGALRRQTGGDIRVADSELRRERITDSESLHSQRRQARSSGSRSIACAGPGLVRPALSDGPEQPHRAARREGARVQQAPHHDAGGCRIASMPCGAGRGEGAGRGVAGSHPRHFSPACSFGPAGGVGWGPGASPKRLG
jgi:hypothetical protein